MGTVEDRDTRGNRGRKARDRARQDTLVFAPRERLILRSFQDLLVDEAMLVPRARTYLAATAVRGPGWRTTYELLSLPPPRERNMFTSGSSSSSSNSFLFAWPSPLPSATGHRGAWRRVVLHRVASRRVATLPPAGENVEKKEKRDAVVAGARNTIASLTRETASATSSLTSRISSHEPVTICPSLSLSRSVRPCGRESRDDAAPSR